MIFKIKYLKMYKSNLINAYFKNRIFSIKFEINCKIYTFTLII